MGNIIGPDVSFYQDDPGTPEGIDFVKMRQNAEFVIIRAGQNLWPDSDFAYNWGAARDAGLPRGSYWFYDSRAEPKRQAELWVQQLGNDLGELPLFADFEESYGGPYKGWQTWYDFLERLKALVGGKEICIYTAYYYWTDNAPNATTQPDNLDYFHQYPLWVANYGASKPRVPKPWGEEEWLFWQYTESGNGTQYGVESNAIDLNYFNGDLDTFRQRFGLQTPEEEIEVGKKYHIELGIREGPGTSFDAIGTLKHGDVIEALGSTPNFEWVQFKRKDGLTGWASTDILIPETSTPPVEPPPVEPPPEPEVKWYRVTATALNVRQGPSTSNTILGTLLQNQVVKALETNSDGSWIKILRESDGLTGWSYARYLTLTNAPPAEPPVEPPPTPPPSTHVQKWYRVKATKLNVREGPGTSFTAVGYLLRDEVVISLDANLDESWLKIQRFDGLTGWCSTAYLEDLGETAPSQLTQKIFNGITYMRKEIQGTRKMVGHVMAIDMRASGLQCLVTPPSHSSGIMCATKTSDFLSQTSTQVAINGDGFSYLDPATINPLDYCPNGEDPVDVNSYAASRGTIYSARLDQRPILYINANNVVTVNSPKGSVYNAISGDRMLVEKGKRVDNLENQSVEPRSAVGMNQNGRWLMLVVVDGRQPDYSEGISFPELADFLITLGVYQGMNLDGGGSSTLVIEGKSGAPHVLNSPIEGNIPGNEAAVANHLGFFVKK